ncbi:MAG TPA: ATP-binding protein [Steroidobacteraceae bacterium]|nr:ATP-binding protein [Steroidobacteraceae bacterium]
MSARRIGIRFPGTHAGFAQGFARLREALDAERLAGTARYNAELVFEEIVANIVSHGARNGREADVCVTLEPRADSIVLIFSDDGVPFDPRGRPDPVIPKTLAEAKIGGFGLMLVRHAASSLDYVRTADDRNRLTVIVPRG